MRKWTVLLCLAPLVSVCSPLGDVWAGGRLLTHAGEGEPREIAQAQRVGPDRVARYGMYGPDLVLLHGAHEEGIDHPRFVKLAEALADEGLRVYVPELPGLKALRFDPADLDVIDRGPDGAAVFGISLGGGLALRYVAEHPDKYRMVWTLGAHYDLGDVVAHHLEHEDGDPYAREVFQAAFGDELERRGPRAFANVWSAMSPVGRIGNLQVPVFALHGVIDPLVPPEHATRICEEAPRCRALVTPVLGHSHVNETPLTEQVALARFAGEALRATRRF